MKFFIVALSLAAICCVSALNYEHIQKVRKVVQDCADELGVTSEELQKYQAYIKSFEDEPKAQNFAKCSYQNMGLIDQNGNFQENVAIEQLTNFDVLEESVKQCTVPAGDNTATTFYVKLYACHKEAIDAVKLSRHNN